MSKRPTRLTQEMRRKAARKAAQEVRLISDLDKDIEVMTAEIASVCQRHMDGYEIAKALDQRHGWKCDLGVAEALDTFSIYAELEIKLAQRQWAEENNIQPPVSIGERVQALWGGEKVVGTIQAIYRFGSAQYVMSVEGSSSTGRAIVNFEDVLAIGSPEPGRN